MCDDKFWQLVSVLQEIVASKSLRLCGMVGIYPANSVGDDIQVYEHDDARDAPLATFHGLRQQADKDGDDPFMCISDFVAPKETGLRDYLGMFANAAFGAEALVARYKEAGDDYNHIMVDAIADRLAEVWVPVPRIIITGITIRTQAFAEKLHELLRKELWGYAPDEQLSTDDLLKVRYRGIRPAPGYPSQPDHTEKRTMWELMGVKEATGMDLTESMAMLPAAAVSGLYFAGACSSYFAVGKITQDQVVDYARRKRISVEEAQKWLAPMLNYEP